LTFIESVCILDSKDMKTPDPSRGTAMFRIGRRLDRTRTEAYAAVAHIR
jgi:hypothetical protein